MNKIFYIITVAFLFILGWPLIIFNKDKWNRLGEKVDNYFKIESQYSINKKNKN